MPDPTYIVIRNGDSCTKYKINKKPSYTTCHEEKDGRYQSERTESEISTSEIQQK